MGFNIESFFNTLIEILSRDIEEAKKVDLLVYYVKEMKEYARKCGVID